MGRQEVSVVNHVTIQRNVIEKEYMIAEAYKSLRTNIQFCGGDKKVLVVTSCIPNEGKSSVTLNLAATMAEAGKRVLMIDGDLRKSVIMRKIQVEDAAKGLTHYLSRQAQLKEVICTTDVKNLFLVLPGPVPPNPAELLGSPAFSGMLKTLRDIYDYIIIDSPPLGSVIDGAVIAEKCDGSVLVMEAGMVSYRFAQNVKVQLEKAGSPILGVILNKIDVQTQGYYGKYGKYYGKYYG